ncbi:hypothetical protein HY003_03265 [Candidatus Saccharibacteria bacterium]|nr:hypothetical protein [Candidatus Saccharibacteria bacterium]MBI3338295.1 hypothetical protein [Candidatus Saccharibacteria bacterium]
MFKHKTSQQPRRKPVEGQSASAFTYYASRSRTEVPTGRQVGQSINPKKHQWWHHLPTFLAALIMIVCAGYVLTLNTSPRVVLFSDADGRYLLRSLNTYQKATNQIIKKSIFNRTKLTINTNRLAKELKNQFPELGEVSVTIPLTARRLVLEIEPTRPALNLNTKNGVFVIDQTGRAVIGLMDVPKKSNLSVQTVNDDSGLKIEVGDVALSAKTVRFIQEVAVQLQDKKLTVSSMTLPVIANELHVRIGTQPYFIKFNLEAPPRGQAGTYLAVKQRLEADGIIPAEYIDVRIEERAYYR